MSYFWQARQARPVTGRQGGRPNWRGTGDPPVSHMLINEDGGAPTPIIPDNVLVTSSAASGAPLAADDGVTFLTTS